MEKIEIKLPGEDWLLLVAAINVVTPHLKDDLQTRVSEIGQYIKEKTFASKFED